MLKTKFIKEKIDYDGSQLKPLWNYLQHDLLGPSVVAFVGACNVSFDKMIDGEDLKDKSKICSDEMLHFIFEIPGMSLFSAVLVQRLFASIISDFVLEKHNKHLTRAGDDLYLGERKFSISIATCSANAALIHFAVNCVSTGAPVSVVSLADMSIPVEEFALAILHKIENEMNDVQKATWKVFTF